MIHTPKLMGEIVVQVPQEIAERASQCCKFAPIP
jgi:hypothetical protein